VTLKRAIRWGVVLILAGLGIWAVVLSWRADPVVVETALAARGPMSVEIESDGRTRVRNRFVVSAPVSGVLSRIRLQPGDLVERQGAIATLRPAPAEPRSLLQDLARLESTKAAKRAAEARVEQTYVELNFARSELQRIELLVREGIAAQRQLDEARATVARNDKALRAAMSEAEAAASDVATVEAALAATPEETSAAAVVVRAPVAGRVLRLLEQSERVVAAGTPLVELANINSIEIVTDVLSSDAVNIEPGARMIIDQWGGEGTLEGQVRTIEPAAFTKLSALGVEEQRVNVIGDLRLPNPALGDGYRVEVRIVLWESRNILKVPVTALFRSAEDWTVFVVENGRAVLRRLTIGHRNTAEAEVLTGVAEGERVVIHPSDQLSEGVAVRVNEND
jgi:HlyD family secretion protein